MSNKNREIKIKGIALLTSIVSTSQGLNISAEIIYEERLIHKLLFMLA